MSAVSGLGPDRTNLPEGVELARLEVLGARDQGLDLRKRPWRDRCVVESTRETRDAGNPMAPTGSFDCVASGIKYNKSIMSVEGRAMRA